MTSKTSFPKGMKQCCTFSLMLDNLLFSSCMPHISSSEITPKSSLPDTTAKWERWYSCIIANASIPEYCSVIV